jgi:hypothetical protein
VMSAASGITTTGDNGEKLKLYQIKKAPRSLNEGAFYQNRRKFMLPSCPSRLPPEAEFP